MFRRAVIKIIKKVKLDDIYKIDFYVVPNNGRQNVNEVFNKFKPDYIINGNMYDMKTGQTCADAIDEGMLIGGGNWSDKGIAIKNKKDISWSTTSVARKDGTRDFIGSAPTLVINGKVELDTKGLSSSFYNSSRRRSFVGFNSKEFMFGCTDSSSTCNSLAIELVKNGFEYALNLDGGGSSVCGEKDANGKLRLLNKPTETRRNSNWILIYLKPKAKPAPPGAIKVSINGTMHLLDGHIENGRTYIQIRQFGEITNLYSLGYDKVPIINTHKQVVLGPSQKDGLKVIINGVDKIVDGQIKNGRTYIQIRNFGDITGLYNLGFENGVPQIFLI